MDRISYALVIGSADTVFTDLAALAGFIARKDPVTIGVNDGGWLYPARLDHWCTLHWEKMGGWLERRARPGEFVTWCRDSRKLDRYKPRPDRILPHWGTGTSGLYGVAVAEELAADRVILAGVPMESRPHADGAGTWDGAAWPDTEVMVHRDGWTYWHERGRLANVKSMSGWTRDLLGDPPTYWLA